MSRTSRGREATAVAGIVAMLFALLGLLMAALPAPAEAAPATTCDDLGYPSVNKVETDGWDQDGDPTIQGPWGSLSWNGTAVTPSIKDGWQVMVCLKPGQGKEQNQPIVVTLNSSSTAFDISLAPYGVKQAISHGSWKAATQPNGVILGDVTTDRECGEPTTVDVGPTANITYSTSVNGVVTATPAQGFKLVDSANHGWTVAPDGSSASYTYEYEDGIGDDCRVEAILSDVDTDRECGEATTVDVRPTANITYDTSVNGVVTATPAEGFKLVDQGDEWMLNDNGTATATYEYDDGEDDVCAPPPPQVASTVSEVDGEFQCDADTFVRTTTTTTTTTPFVLDEESGTYVLDTAAATVSKSTSQEQVDVTKELLEEKGCEPVVLDTVLEKDPPNPAPVVLDTAKDLPKAGATSGVLLIWGGALLALGCGLLLTERRLARAGR